ncbi:flagellar protein FliS [Paenibacillus sp. J53TS2]|uniref:flagellar export chaperone FliS n=1 Tax=Paenibacillus sp. J53TS2 TaxID=2807197 RepID=UPI001B15CF1A|nr:flagellar export chaperone FliS [Paenibacillus sp. J53TS2]GIP47425.1 flagellar protein FliS [Paenibacillus sp. J53TS2]
MGQQAQETYLRMQVQTAAPWELTTMLFNGSIKFMKQAKLAIENKDYESKNANIKKTIDILDELLITLNHSYDISKQLQALYNYMKERLFLANTKLSNDYIEECIDLMVELRDTWVQAMKGMATTSAKVHS